MTSSLSGQSVGLWGQASHVASWVSHSAGIENPSEEGVFSGGAAIIRLCAKIVDLPTMLKTPHSQRRYREDLSEMPNWLKKKTCPNRDKYLSGKRILPKNLTGKEKLADLVDNTFLAYNAARLKEGCQLFAERMLEPDV